MSLNLDLKGTNQYLQLLSLYQTTSQNHDNQKLIDILPQNVAQKFFWHIWDLADRPSEENYGKIHALDHLERLHLAVQYTVNDLFDVLNEGDKKKVGGKIWYHFGSPSTDDRNWGENRAKDNPALLLRSLHECFGSENSWINGYLNLFDLRLEDYGLKNGDLDEGGRWSVLLNHVDLEVPKEITHQTIQFSNGEPRWVKDEMSCKFYFNEDPLIVRSKCFLLLFGTVLYSVLSAIISAIRLIVALSAVQLWFPRADTPWEERVKDWKANVASLIITPIALLQMEKAALKGVFGSEPYDVRKNFTSWEQLIRFKILTIAPCFHPLASSHFFGGDPFQQNAF